MSSSLIKSTHSEGEEDSSPAKKEVKSPMMTETVGKNPRQFTNRMKILTNALEETELPPRSKLPEDDVFRMIAQPQYIGMLFLAYLVIAIFSAVLRG